jgi:predicted O-methyltransferase YrrM
MSPSGRSAEETDGSGWSPKGHRVLPVLFSLVIFVNAFLLFWIEPLFSKTLLPIFGGSASVWTTAVFFYQLLLLLGYLYAHLIDRHLNFTAQWILQLVLLTAALIWAPMGPDSLTLAGGFKLGSISRQMLIMLTHLGLPFFTICTFSTLLQRWFSRLPEKSARDPYFLYTVSNWGSISALILFPFLLEPRLGTVVQFELWRAGLVLLLLLVAVSGAWVRVKGTTERTTEKATGSKPSWMRLGRWTLWAFIPAGMMLAITTLISVDLVSFPLLWIVPLLIYLLTFVLAFSKRFVFPLSGLRKGFIVTTVFALFAWLTEIERPLWLILLLFLAQLFFCSLYYHRRLYEDRPAVGQLTLFYLCTSVGGVLSGAFNSIVAPLCFTTIFEFPLLTALSLLVLVEAAGDFSDFLRRGRERWLALTIAVLAFGMTALSNWITLDPYVVWMTVIYAVPLMLALALEKKPAGLALALILIMVSSAFMVPLWGRVELKRRNAFGTLSVVRDEAKGMVKLFHGTTQHGIERRTVGSESLPLAYYHPSGPCGIIFKALYRDDSPKRVSLIGLGIGSQLAYARPHDDWTVFEIDPNVIDIATDARYFSYWSRCPASKRLVAGDGRIMLSLDESGPYDLIIVDAFNSDAIPLHLLTREAFSLYLSRLKGDGLIALHVTNRNIDLLEQLQHLASALDLTALSMVDTDDSLEGKFASHWVLFGSARRILDLGIEIGPVTSWILPRVSKPRPWRDDWNNLLGVIRWRQ